MTAMPSAPPSTGSVPAPTSSSRTSAGSARFAIHRHDVGDVRRERAEAGGDRLLVADVGKERSEHRQPRSLVGRDVQARLRHRCEQPRRLERHGLAAGVGPGDDEHAHRRREQDVDGTGSYRQSRPSSERSFTAHQQRVPRAFELEGAVGRDHRLDAADRQREARARLDHIELGGDVDRAAQIVRPAAERVGQRQQDAADLLGLLLLERDDVVVDLDGPERLENRLAPLADPPWTMPGIAERCSARTIST